MSDDIFPNVGSDLVRIHKVITRALAVSMQSLQDNSLPENQRQGFVSYVRALTILLHAHHSSEDEIAFPFWKLRMPTGPFDELMIQHQEMIPYLVQIEGWIGSGSGVWDTDMMNELRRTLSALESHWHKHIRLEEETVGPDKSSQYLTSDENDALSRKLSEHGQAHSQPGELVIPFIVYNLEGEDRNGFTQLLPPVMMEQLIPVAWKTVWEPMKPFLLFE